MSTAIAFIVTVGLLTLVVIALHRYQLSVTQSNANKGQPLPPLDYTKAIKPPVTEFDPDKTLPPFLADKFEPAQEPVQKQDSPVQEELPETPWIERVAKLKKLGKLNGALAVCENAYPLWSAYQQAALVLRAQIKALQKQDEPIDDALTNLYRLAAVAAFLHDRVKGLPDLTLNQLKLLDLDQLQSLDMPYSSIGYLELRLIKKTDIKLLLDKWGKPESHLNPRQFNSSSWVKIATSQKTLF